MATNSRAVPSPLGGGASSSAAQAGRSSGAQVENGSQAATATEGGQAKRKRHKNKKRKNRRQSFAPQADIASASDLDPERPSIDVITPGPRSANRSNFYRLQQGRNSNTSLESTTLLDHRDYNPLPKRRYSLHQSSYSNRSGQLPSRARPSNIHDQEILSEDAMDPTDITPLIGSHKPLATYHRTNSGLLGFLQRRNSNGSSRSSRKRKGMYERSLGVNAEPDFDVNNPPSVPGSPKVSDLSYDDVLMDSHMSQQSQDTRRSGAGFGRDAIIDIDSNDYARFGAGGASPRRRMTTAEDDVCFPQEVMESEFGDEDLERLKSGMSRQRRRRARNWPDLAILEEWSHEEKEERAIEGIRARRVSEPLMIGGRLRTKQTGWHREDDDAPYRFTYFNEEVQSTIHSQTISELLQDGQTFKDLFRPNPPELSESSSDEEDNSTLRSPGLSSATMRKVSPNKSPEPFGAGRHDFPLKQSSMSTLNGRDTVQSPEAMTPGTVTPTQGRSTPRTPKPKKYGPRPTFWLDVLQPTDTEMKVISKAFGLHPLTAEDIMLQEAREKVELFGHYYFLNYRTFEQDSNSEDYLEPVDFYAVVFREGVISFHFSMTPHPANVRRRIRQLSDYLISSSDWISYAIIDDITDVYQPLIERIEDEVDQIDDEILELHAPDDASKTWKDRYGNEFEKVSQHEKDDTAGDVGGDMLRRVGVCRKKVMSLYRLLGNKADVIKGFAKRCNEHWEVAPRSEIGMYLGDIQDHIVTMTGNLTHYENLLSRAHSNYLAQINIRMSERAERTNDVLGKLTVLGTIVLPMNIITGMWGMNVLVPGQDVVSLTWFWCITAGLAAFGVCSFLIAKRVYGIV